MSSRQQRVYNRAPVHFDVEFTHAGQTGRGIGLNLGERGMFVATEQPAPPKAEVSLQLAPPGLCTPISIRAGVVWVRREARVSSEIAGMGVRFLAYTLTPRELAGEPST